MFKLPQLFKTQEDPYFLTIDIGSDLVKVLACRNMDENPTPLIEIVGLATEPLGLDMVRGGVVLDADGVASTIKSAVLNATVMLDGKCTKAIVGLSGDLSLCILTTVRVVRGKAAPIDSEEVALIHEKIHDEAQTEAFNQIMESSGNSDINIQLITSSVVYTKLDGNLITDLVGRVGQEVEIALFTSFTPAFNTEILNDVIKKADLKIMAVASEMYALTRSLKVSKGANFDGVIVDMGSDITDIGVVFGGGIVSSKTLPLGGAHFTRQISEKTGLSYYGAEDKKIAFSYGNLTEEEELSIQDAMERVYEVWLDGIELAFTEFTGIKTFASNVYLVGGGVLLPDIKERLKHEPWTRSIPFKSPPDFITLNISDLHLIKDSTGRLDSPAFVLPAALSIVYLEMNGYLDE